MKRNIVIAKFAEVMSLCPPEELADLNQALIDYMDGDDDASADGLEKVVRRNMPLSEGGIDTNYREFEDGEMGLQPTNFVMIGATVQIAEQEGVVLAIDENVAVVDCQDGMIRTSCVDLLTVI